MYLLFFIRVYSHSASCASCSYCDPTEIAVEAGSGVVVGTTSASFVTINTFSSCVHVFFFVIVVATFSLSFVSLAGACAISVYARFVPCLVRRPSPVPACSSEAGDLFGDELAYADGKRDRLYVLNSSTLPSYNFSACCSNH